MIVQMIAALLGILVVASPIEAKINYTYYCDTEWECTNPLRQHVMCENEKQWGSACVEPKMHVMTDARKKRFLDAHNAYRNILALGKLRDVKEVDGIEREVDGVFTGKTAVDMGEMIWDDELEMFAQKHLSACVWGHDKCRRNKRLRHPGQNMASITGVDIKPEEVIDSANKGWWEEHNNITEIDSNNTYGSIKANDKYGHFTVMSGNQANLMGCAFMSMFYKVVKNRKYFKFMTACNYGSNNMPNQAVYEVGQLRSKCKTNSTIYDGLCGKNEDYRRNTNFYTGDRTTAEPVKQWRDNKRMLDFLGEAVNERKPMEPDQKSTMPDQQTTKPDKQTMETSETITTSYIVLLANGTRREFSSREKANAFINSNKH